MLLKGQKKSMSKGWCQIGKGKGGTKGEWMKWFLACRFWGQHCTRRCSCTKARRGTYRARYMHPSASYLLSVLLSCISRANSTHDGLKKIPSKRAKREMQGALLADLRPTLTSHHCRHHSCIPSNCMYPSTDHMGTTVQNRTYPCSTVT